MFRRILISTFTAWLLGQALLTCFALRAAQADDLSDAFGKLDPAQQQYIVNQALIAHIQDLNRRVDEISRTTVYGAPITRDNPLGKAGSVVDYDSSDTSTARSMAIQRGVAGAFEEANPKAPRTFFIDRNAEPSPFR